MALTSLSWLLPVELSPDGLEIVALHYDRAVAPSSNLECYGVEDARISRVDGRWLMTACAVSPERHSTVLYSSANGLDWRFERSEEHTSELQSLMRNSYAVSCLKK